MRELDETGVSPNHSARHGSRVRLFVIHTQEGNGSARSLANYLQNPNSGVSYHYTVDNRECIAVVDTDRSSWSVLDANPLTINLCYGGSSVRMSTDQWMERFADAIDYTAHLFVQDAMKYDPLEPTMLDWGAIGAGRGGGTDHYGITMGLGIGDHTDVGRNFPWGFYNERLAAHAAGKATAPAVPVENQIDKQAAVTPWLGKRLTSEQGTPDGRGRFAQWENGYIYWTPTTGAIVVPNNIFEMWAEVGWEAGPMGYPIAHHTLLPIGGVALGDVQAFEGGVAYRKYGQRGHWVFGAIGERWKRDGFETGRWGWPISNEVKLSTSTAYQDFEGGRIGWSSDGTLALIPTGGADEIVPATAH